VMTMMVIDGGGGGGGDDNDDNHKAQATAHAYTFRRRNPILCYLGQMQNQGQVQGRSQLAGGGRMLQLAQALRQAVLRGQTIVVHQLLSQGAPLVTDSVNCVLSFT